MDHNKKDASPSSGMRNKAEKILEKREQNDDITLSIDEAKRLIHELEVHQIELELQNEELLTAQNAIDKSRSRYAELYDFAPVGYFTLNKDGLIEEINLTGAGLLGIERQHLINTPITRYIKHDSQDLFYFHRKKLFETEQFQACEIQMKRSDGTFFNAGLESVPVDGKTGAIDRMRMIVTDITERIHLEEKFHHAQKMETVALLTGGVAHEFNNILMSIIGCGEIMKNYVREDDPLHKYVSMILSSAHRAADLTSGLLSYSRLQITHRRPVRLNKVVSIVKNLLGNVIDENIELVIHTSKEELIVDVDLGQFEQVLINLVINACDAMPHGGVLTITTDGVMIDDTFIDKHYYGKKGHYARITVSDTGVGIDGEHVERIFEPFFTTKDVGKGTGLGLSVVYGIIKKHDGYIDVNSVPGEGTTFLICIPVSGSVDEGTVSNEHHEYRQGTETVLVADDDGNVRDVVRHVLQDCGYKVIATGNGDEAVKRFRSDPDAIDLLVLDMKMPRKTGYEAFKEMREMRSDIKVLFISGYAERKLLEQNLIPKHLELLYKPFSPDDLLANVRRILDMS